MSTSALSRSTSTTTPPVGAVEPTQPKPKPVDTTPGGALGKDAFMKLLVAQLKNQDPMNPQDGQQMAAQLAQFTSVEQLQKLNETMTAGAAGQGAMLEALTSGMTLNAVGKTVEVDPSRVTGPDGKIVGGSQPLTGTVDGVKWTASGPVLTCGQYSFPFSAIRRLTEPAAG